MNPIKIAPSLLSADFAALGKEVTLITEAKADWIHFDVMDGAFVPNLTMGPQIVKALRPYSTLPFDVHLMIYRPEQFIEPFIEAGANIVTIHQEATSHLHRHLTQIRKMGAKAGVSLNPGTCHTSILPILEAIDLILIMSVNPGFGGQHFIESQLKKIEALSSIIRRENLNIELQVDGGINMKTAGMAIKAGATCLVAGTSVFEKGPSQYAACIQDLKNSIL
ncbi:MAG: ribulose-phosphate 3-epimerase [Alphaproteobacteria bacterium]|nr:ribulose-phosphate 3-epimerase [Alphaproteobacteria bacterium]